jgi:hypothetical protein
VSLPELGSKQLRLWSRGALIASVAFALTALGLQPITRAADAPPSRLLVIGHPGTVPARLDADLLQQAFLKQRMVWPSGARVVPFNFPPSDPVRVAFDRAALGMSPVRSAAYWIDARIRHGLDAPRTVSSATLAINIVARLPGSIAYVPEAALPANVNVVARIEGDRVVAP